MKTIRYIKSFSALLLLFLFSAGCEKDDTIMLQFNSELNDTIQPKTYFPIYPGSWWTYIDNFGDTVQKTAGPYVLHSFSPTPNTSTQTAARWVPFWEGKYYYGYAYPVTFGVSQHGGGGSWIVMADVLRENSPGAEWQSYSYILAPPNGPYYKDKRKVMHSDTSITVQNLTYLNCIHIRATYESFNPNFQSVATTTYTDFYYAPNVGLIRTDAIDTTTFIATPTLELVSYYINH